MKKVLLFIAMLISMASFGQKPEDAKKLTKFEEFTSKTGSIIKFVDISLPRFELNSGSLETGIRTIKGSSNSYFYRLEKPETSSSSAKIAMIEYSDLVEINKALSKLSSEIDSDMATAPYYLENKFRTVDGFEIGYYISKGQAGWYMKLEKYSSSTVFSRDRMTLLTAFKNAQSKIEELKASGK